MGEWQIASGGSVPDNAFRAGSDGSPVYVIRAWHEGDLLPGKLASGSAYVPYGGAEIKKDDYEVLVGSNYSWVGHHPSAPLPGNAVPGGQTSSGETLYIAHVSIDGVDVIGKVHFSHGKAYIPYFGKELSYENFEILVYDSLTPWEGSIYWKTVGDEYHTLGATAAGWWRHAVVALSMGEWQGASCGHAPGNAFYAGNDRGPVYVGRAHHKCDLLPGKVCRGKAYFPYGGEEITKIDYEVLVGCNYSWVGHHPSAPLPGNVVPGGQTASGETLYIAKVSRDGVDVVGKVHLSHGRAYLPFDGKEHGYENYNILVKN